MLASDTIRNWTIVNLECIVHVRLLLPLSVDLGNVMKILLDEARAVSGVLAGRGPAVRVNDLPGDKAEVTVEVWVRRHSSALRVRIQDRLRADGVLA